MSEARIDPKDVSVVVPAYRAQATIGRALASVAAQTALPGEVVVVDDGSDDATADAARDAARALPGGVAFKLVEQPNAGAGAARNRALAEASGTWVAFLDADDAWLPEKLERSLAALAMDGLDLVAHNSWTVTASGNTLNDCARRYREGADPFVALYRKGYLDTCTVVMRRADALAAGGFDEALPNAQDFELWLRVLRDPAKRFAVLDDVLAEAHETPGSVMSFVERRLACCRTVAVRYADALRGRPGGVWPSLWFRLAAVHAEAAAAHRRRGDLVRGVWAAARLAGSLVSDSLALARGTAPPRRAYLSPEALP